MASKILTATVAPVEIGYLSLEGLLAENGEFYVGFPQLTSYDLVPPNRSLKQLESLLGIDLQSHVIKLKTPLNPKAVNAISLKGFDLLLLNLDRAGNESAQKFRDDLVGLSLQQLFCDAFGVKFEQDDRQRWLRERQEGKGVRRTFTDAIRSYLSRHNDLSENRVKFMYSNASNAVNRAIFGRVAKRLCQDFQVPDWDLLRDRLTAEELRHISQVEDLAMRIVDQQDIDPVEAVKDAQSKLLIPISQRTA